MKTYSVTHTLGRASIITADLDAIVREINESIWGSGISTDKALVIREAKNFCPQGWLHLLEVSEAEIIG